MISSFLEWASEAPTGLAVMVLILAACVAAWWVMLTGARHG